MDGSDPPVASLHPGPARVSAGVPVRDLAERADPDEAPVVFLHGLLESTALWSVAAESCARAGVAAVAMPLPAHHPWSMDSETLRRLLAGDTLARRYAAAIRARFGGRPVRLVGHSTGGMLALEIAAVAPELVTGILTIGALFADEADRPTDVLRLLTRHPLLGPASFRWLMWWWQWDEASFTRGVRRVMAPGTGPPDIPADMLADLRRSDPEAIRRVALWVAERDIANRLGAIRQPVCCVIGRRDPVVPATHQVKLIQSLPNARALLLSCGHLPMIETPALFGRTLDTWLAEGTARPGSASALRRAPALRNI